MFIRSHLKIAEAVIGAVEVHLPFKINGMAFRLGSILPDLMPASPDHVIEKSFDYVASLIGELEPGKIITGNAGMDGNFFIKLGIIAHYLTDYFCYVHNDACYTHFLKHYRYENHLHRELNSYNLTQFCSPCLSGLNTRPFLRQEGLVEYVQTRHCDYLSEIPGFSHDIQYGLEIVTIVVASILGRCKTNMLDQAA